ncbi:hypothetical protein FRC03_001476, partial [Tulasnella sp. 419]
MNEEGDHQNVYRNDDGKLVCNNAGAHEQPQAQSKSDITEHSDSTRSIDTSMEKINSDGVDFSNQSPEAKITDIERDGPSRAEINKIWVPRDGEREFSGGSLEMNDLITIKTLVLLAEEARDKYVQGQSGVSSLESAVVYYRAALQSCPKDNQWRPGLLSDFGVSLRFLWEAQGDMHVLDEAISCQEEALELRPIGHPQRSISLTKLANCLFIRYNWQGDITNLNKAIELHRDVSSLHPKGHPDRAMSLSNLATCLLSQYEQLGDIGSLDEAIRYYKDVLELRPIGHPDRAMTLNNLATSLLTHYEQCNGIEELKEAIQYSRDALDLRPNGHPKRSKSLSNLANCLFTLYQRQSDINCLNEAIKCHRGALDLRPRGNPQRIGTLTNLGICLWAQYTQQGNVDDLDEAVLCCRESLSLCPINHPLQSISSSNLAACLKARYGQQGELKDLKEAIECLRHALHLQPEGHHARYTSLNNLANSLLALYEAKKDIRDLDEAIRCHRSAVTLCSPDFPNLSMALHNLATSLFARYKENDDINDLEEAIRRYTEVLTLRPVGHPDRVSSLYSMANCLSLLYALQGDAEILKTAVNHLLESTEIAPPGHPLLANAWEQLAYLYADYPDVLGDSCNVQEPFDLFSKAINHPTASLKTRFEACIRWINRQSGPTLLSVYGMALNIGDQYLLLRPSIVARHEFLSSIPNNLASDAAAVAIQSQDIKKAVQFLEQGRRLLWAQMGRYRTPLDALKQVNPELADRFSLISNQLEVSATVSRSEESSKQSVEEQASEYRHLVDEWDAVLEEIRQVKGFETFLQAPDFNTLRLASRDGPVIVINISEKHCDAIIVQVDGDPLCVALPELNPSYFDTLASQFLESIELIRAAQEDSTALKNARRVITAILKTLWDDVTSPVVIELQKLGVPAGSRIWLCPTSSLVSLPLHAAGIYQKNKPKLPDLYITSYTPSLSALVSSYQTKDLAQNTVEPPFRQLSGIHLLVAAQPDVPNEKPLVTVHEEVARIKTIVPSEFVTNLFGKDATHDALLQNIGNHNWMHLSCHGVKNPTQPFLSCFKLLEGSLSLLEIMQAHLPEAEFAFLSACHSA